MATFILILLVALSFPLIGGVTTLRDNVICSSNLRQIGLGILQFAADNADRLPGPLYSGQYPFLNDPSQLSYQLTNYVYVDQTRVKTLRPDIFLCPAYKRVVSPVGYCPVYVVNVKVLMDGVDGKRPPFGYPNSLYPVVFNTNRDYQPMRLSSLSRIVDDQGAPAMTKTWFMKDVDQSDPMFVSLPVEYIYKLPTRMVHKNHRNALFFDFHVSGIDQNNQTN